MKTAQLTIITVAAVLLTAVPALCLDEFQVETISLPETDCLAPKLASSDDGVTVVSFTTKGVLAMEFIETMVVPTRALQTSLPTHPGAKFPDFWGDPQTMASGNRSEVCWSRDGFTLVATDGLMLSLFQGDHEGVWNTENVEYIPTGGNLISLDLLGIRDGVDGPSVYLAWTVVGPGGPFMGDGKLYCASRTTAGWSDPVLLAEDMPYAQAALALEPGIGSTQPRVYFPGPMGLVFRTRNAEGEPFWDDTELLLDGTGSELNCLGWMFDAVTTTDQESHILGLGPLPTCPCGSVHHLWTEGGQWQACDNWTLAYGGYDQPWSPRIAAGPDGVVHAFWHQQRTSSDLIPNRAYLEYRVGDGDNFTDAGDFLDDEPAFRIKSDLDLSVSPEGHPVLAWCRRDTVDEVEQPRVIRLARQIRPSAVPEARPQLELTAWPNPFNPRVTLDFTLEREQVLRLAVYDARGHLVRRLRAGHHPVGPVQTVWDGTDELGTSMPSGVYFARLETADGVTARKLVLNR